MLNGLMGEYGGLILGSLGIFFAVALSGAGSAKGVGMACLLYTSPSPRDLSTSRMPSSA